MAYHRINILSFVLYIVALTGLMVWLGIGITPDRYVLVLLLISLFLKRTRKFVMDWLPFLFILITYDFLRSFANVLNPRVHFLEPAMADKFLFGQLPTITLQNLLYTPGFLHWYDYLSGIIYFLHFALPLGFAFILWLKNNSYFKQFVIAILFLSYAGWITYLAYPAAPPWLASNQGYISGVTKILDVVLKTFPERLNLPTIYYSFDPNLVAAVPSLHAAYAMLVFLFALKFFKRKALFFALYVLGVWFSIIYLGEHYFIDVVLGVIYAVVFFYVTQFLYKIYQRRLAKSLDLSSVKPEVS